MVFGLDFRFGLGLGAAQYCVVNDHDIGYQRKTFPATSSYCCYDLGIGLKLTKHTFLKVWCEENHRYMDHKHTRFPSPTFLKIFSCWIILLSKNKLVKRTQSAMPPFNSRLYQVNNWNFIKWNYHCIGGIGHNISLICHLRNCEKWTSTQSLESGLRKNELSS